MTSLSFALLGTVKVSAKCSTQEMEYLAECSYKSIIPFPLFFLQLLCTDLPSKRSTFDPLGTQPAKLSQVMWGERESSGAKRWKGKTTLLLCQVKQLRFSIRWRRRRRRRKGQAFSPLKYFLQMQSSTMSHFLTSPMKEKVEAVFVVSHW